MQQQQQQQQQEQQQQEQEQQENGGGGDGSSPDGLLPGQSFGTYDEASMQHSHHFLVALQELKNLRPQLYSAAEYCESSYLYSNQKQGVLENLKDYSVKALVNAVDHLGTVAFKLNDLLTQQVSEISSAEIRAGSLTQRLRSCQEHSDREGLKQQSLAKSTQANHKHYVLPDSVAEVSGSEGDPDVVIMLRETFDLEEVQSQAQTPDGSNSSRNLAWHFAVDRSPAKTTSSRTMNRPTSSRHFASPLRDFEGSFSRESDSSNSGPLLISERSKQNPRARSTDVLHAEERAKSVERVRSSEKSKSSRMPGRSQSTERRPSSKNSIMDSSMDRATSHLIVSEPDRDLRAPSRSKSLLRSLLSRGKNVSMKAVVRLLEMRESGRFASALRKQRKMSESTCTRGGKPGDFRELCRQEAHAILDSYGTRLVKLVALNRTNVEGAQQEWMCPHVDVRRWRSPRKV